ncbi:MAG: hypothetical protein U0V56_11930 [Actinomycetota bacterium]
MNIGEPKHVREIEPVDVPLPTTVPLPAEEPASVPAGPDPEPAHEPAEVPAG